MPQLHNDPMLLQFLVNPGNNIMDQLPYLPGFNEIQSGQPLTPDEFLRFRNYLFKTMQLHRQRHVARVHLNKLYHRGRVERWVHRFAPFSTNLTQALLPLIKTCCYSFTWPYAELWHLSDTPGARTIKVVNTFFFAYDRWIIVEPVLAKLDAHMKTRTITLPSREIPGDAFTSHKPAWAIECVDCCPDEQRRKLLKDAFIEEAFVIPLPGDLPRTVSHSLVFYGKAPSSYTNSGPRRFLEHAAPYIKACFGKVEVIGDEGDDDEDIEEEVKEKPEVKAVEAKGVMGAIRTPAAAFRRLRRSQSYVHNLRNLNREL